MALSEKEMRQIITAVKSVARKSENDGRRAAKNIYRETERRLRAYPTLKANIARHEADIEDIKHEEMGKSTDIVMFQSHSGKTPESDLEELRQEKIFSITEKILRDSKETDEIDVALEYTKSYEYYRIIPLLYFENKTQQEIEKELNCDRSTIWRNRKMLVNRISEVLYGADAIG